MIELPLTVVGGIWVSSETIKWLVETYGKWYEHRITRDWKKKFTPVEWPEDATDKETE